MNRDQKLITSIIHRHLPGCVIFLFGSRARGDNLPGADYDIAINAEVRVDRAVMNAICADLEESELPVFVDVVDLCAVKQEFLEAIKKDLQPWS